MNRWSLAVIIWIVAIIQAYFMSALTASYWVPNLLLLVLLPVVLNRSVKLAIAAALWGGFWLDVASSVQFGLRMLLLLLFVLAVVGLQRLGLEFERRVSQLIVLASGLLLYNLGLLIGLWLNTQHLSWPPILLARWSLELMVTLLLAWLVSSRLQRLVAVKASGPRVLSL